MADLMVSEDRAEIIRRPEAPYDLTDEQSEEWHAIVNTMPADHFMRGNYPLLAQLCRHIISARRVAQLVDQTAKRTDLDCKEFGALLQLQATESTMITRLLRAMRLTQQSVMRAETTKHPKGLGKAPWDPE
jgi:chaperone required for assembly of F1-ATPase